MDAVSQLLARHAAALPPRVLYVNPPEQLPRLEGASLWLTDWSKRHRYPSNIAIHFGDTPPAQVGDTPPAQAVDLIILNWPKSHSLGQQQLAQLAATQAPGCRLWLVGEKRSGVATAAKALANSRCWQPPVKTDAARHCLQFSSQLMHQGSAVTATTTARFSVNSGAGELQLANLAGVFGESGLDDGTALLLGQLDNLPVGPIVDVGCGCGVIGLALAQRGHADGTLGDVNPIGLAASRANAAANGLQVKVVASDLLADLPTTPLAVVITNPPFHDGQNTTLAISQQLISESWQRLLPGGELRLVANRHLPYGDYLAAQFGDFTVLAENNRFKVYRAVRR